MEQMLISVISFFAAAATLLSGFGLGTVLTPVFALVYDVKTAVFLVAIVHLLNNLLKLFLFRKHIDLGILRRFGVLAVIGALFGAFAQAYLGNAGLKKFLGAVLLFLGAQELAPSKIAFRFPRAVDPIGGFFSGLLGGLVGNQGAIRAAFLLNYGLAKEAFVATGVVIACFIDVVRIPVYWSLYGSGFQAMWAQLLLVVSATFLGTLFGTQILKRFSLSRFRRLVAGLILAMGCYFLIF